MSSRKAARYIMVPRTSDEWFGPPAVITQTISKTFSEPRMVMMVTIRIVSRTPGTVMCQNCCTPEAPSISIAS